MAAWAQELSNAAVQLYHHHNDYSAAGLADRLAGAATAARQLFHLATAQYDYLEYRQRDPVGAELYKATEAVPRNTFRGPKGRRWLSTVARDEVRINIKAAAEARARRRGVRVSPGSGGGGGQNSNKVAKKDGQKGTPGAGGGGGGGGGQKTGGRGGGAGQSASGGAGRGGGSGGGGRTA